MLRMSEPEHVHGGPVAAECDSSAGGADGGPFERKGSRESEDSTQSISATTQYSSVGVSYYSHSTSGRDKPYPATQQHHSPRHSRLWNDYIPSMAYLHFQSAFGCARKRKGRVKLGQLRTASASIGGDAPVSTSFPPLSNIVHRQRMSDDLAQRVLVETSNVVHAEIKKFFLPHFLSSFWSKIGHVVNIIRSL